MTFPAGLAVSPARVLRLEAAGGGGVVAEDAVATEEPLEIRLRELPEERERRLLVTMRTPGNDEDLVVGLLFSEGLVEGAAEVISLEAPPEGRVDPDVARNVLVATLTRSGTARRRLARRHGVVSSACGVCGRRSIESVLGGGLARPPIVPPTGVAAGLLAELPERLRGEQRVFLSTGGLHAAGLFDETGAALAVREDVGRHNATDKAIGAVLRAGGPVPAVLLVSGRIGFEIAQKAVRLAVPVLAAISAPTSLAVDLAEAAGLCLVGFLRSGAFNVYTHPERITALADRP